MNKNLATILKTLISNESCVDASCIKKKIMGIIAVFFALISMFLIPVSNIVKINKSKGADWINYQNFNYGFDDGIMNFYEKCANEKTEITFAKNELTMQNKADKVSDSSIFKKKEYFYEQKQNKNESGKEFKYLGIYIDETTRDFKSFKNFCNDKKKENHTFIVFGKKDIGCFFFNYEKKSYESEIYGDYQNIKISNLNDLYDNNSREKTFNKMKDFFDTTYIEKKRNRIKNEIFFSPLIMAGIIFLFGIIIWFLSHTKNNLYRIHSFWTSLKIACYISLTQSIIVSIIGMEPIIVFVIITLLRIQFLNRIFKKTN